MKWMWFYNPETKKYEVWLDEFGLFLTQQEAAKAAISDLKEIKEICTPGTDDHEMIVQNIKELELLISE